ncbi:TfuA-like protein [Streptomyces sp. NPDC088812]|uniref:TfuA-like protein n=1 Tax=Streptomyces sp. NPDC088812 TaxID=3365905 RepID=UPI0038083E6E
MTIHVFTGPTLSRSDPALNVPGMRVLPPARHGDLFDAEIAAGDTVLLIDGVYHQAPALRHKEILAALGRGIMVIGAASIGALRAAELDRFGMAGIGAVYTAYAEGKITGDDEVAVGQTPDGGHRALTWPVVNLRHVLGLARAAGVLDDQRACGLLEALRAVFYPQRTMAAVRAVCRRRGEADFARWLDEHRAREEHFGDLKRADALAAVHAARGRRTPSAPAAPPGPAVATPYFRQWSNAFARADVGGLRLFTEDRLVYQQVFDAAFPDRWASYLEHCSYHPADGGRGRPLRVRLAEATGGDLPAHRVFHPPVDLRDETTVSLLLAGESAQDRLAVARHAGALARARASRPGFTVAAVRDDITRRLLRQAWCCTEADLDAEASARGMGSGARAVAAAKRLIPAVMEEEMYERMEAARVGR